jgi:MoaA/NifB/PqqE/SkfB family radical SAM enzyme
MAENALEKKRVDIKTGFDCNNKCIFCVQGKKRYQYQNRTTDQVKELLKEARKDSDSIVFTGGEITIREDILELIAYAKSVDYKIIQLQSNGRMFANRTFCEECIEAGATEFSPALHGHIPELHDYLTRSPGSFKQTVRGLINLMELGQYVLTNTVITRSNYRHLPEIAKLLVRYSVSQFQFAFVHAVGAAGENFKSVVPRKSLIEPYVKRGLDIGIMADRSVMTEAIPYCFMRGYEEYVAERIIPRTKIFDAHGTIDDYTDYRLNEGKLKGPPCEKCLKNDECEGPWREYPEAFGWDEFKPVKQPVDS